MLPVVTLASGVAVAAGANSAQVPTGIANPSVGDSFVFVKITLADSAAPTGNLELQGSTNGYLNYVTPFNGQPNYQLGVYNTAAVNNIDSVRVVNSSNKNITVDFYMINFNLVGALLGGQSSNVSNMINYDKEEIKELIKNTFQGVTNKDIEPFAFSVDKDNAAVTETSSEFAYFGDIRLMPVNELGYTTLVLSCPSNPAASLIDTLDVSFNNSSLANNRLPVSFSNVLFTRYVFTASTGRTKMSFVGYRVKIR